MIDYSITLMRLLAVKIGLNISTGNVPKSELLELFLKLIALIIEHLTTVQKSISTITLVSEDRRE